MIDETELADKLRDLADRQEPGEAPVERLLTRGRRQRNVRAVGFTAASMATVVVALTVAVSVTGGAGPGSRAPLGGATTAAEPSFALAAQASTQTTFTFTMTVEDQDARDRPPMVWNGSADPVNDRYSLRGDGRSKVHEERRIGDQCYVQIVPHGGWEKQVLPCGRPVSLGTEAALRTDPVRVLDQLKATGSVTYGGRTGSGAAAVDTFRFSIPEPNTAPEFDSTYTGSVSVTVATNLVDTVVVHSLISPKDSTDPRLRRVNSLTTYEFRDYGTPVSIDVPE